MRCYSCEQFSLLAICKPCQNKFLAPTLHKREINKNLFVYYFYDYDDIKDLINTKYKLYGSRIFNILATNSFKPFANSFNPKNETNNKNIFNQINIIPIDDHIRDNYSHSAILAKHCKSKILKPYYKTLQAQNKVKYAGASKKFRQKNKRDFKYIGNSKQNIILVDDLVTTGQTMKQAKSCVLKYKCKVLFGLSLSFTK
jgi:competence protein ComFC